MTKIGKRILSFIWALCLLLSNFGDMVRPVFGSDWAALETELTASDGYTYSVTVYFDGDTGVPENTELLVTELLAEDDLYGDYVDRSAELLCTEAEDLSLAKAFDITLRDTVTGEERQPETSVRVSIRLMDVDSLEDLGTVNVVHFGEETEVLSSEVTGDAVSFETESFSVYVIAAGESTLCEYFFNAYNSFGEYALYGFYDDQGNYVESQKIKNGEYLIAPHDPPSDPNHPNWEFKGWYEGDSEPDLDAGPFDFSVPQNHEPGITTVYLYAVFAEYAYVSFHGQYDSETQTYPVLKTLRVEVTDGAATAELGAEDAPWYNTDGNSAFPEYQFYGWTASPVQNPGTGFSEVTVPRESEAPYTSYAISEDTDLYPTYQAVHWLSFASGNSGTGATYYSPIAVVATGSCTQEYLAANFIPVRQGYRFLGWYLEVENEGKNAQNGTGTMLIDGNGVLQAVEDNAVGVRSILAGDPSQSSLWLSKNVTLYARWEAVPVDYTVVTWKQRGDGSGYDFAESFVLSAAALPYAVIPAGTTYSSDTAEYTANGAYKALEDAGNYNSVHDSEHQLGDGVASPYAGYVYNAVLSDSETNSYEITVGEQKVKVYTGEKTIAYEGNTVFNLYYDLPANTVAVWKQRTDGSYACAETFTLTAPVITSTLGAAYLDLETAEASGEYLNYNSVHDAYHQLDIGDPNPYTGYTCKSDRAVQISGTIHLFYDLAAPGEPGTGDRTLTFYNGSVLMDSPHLCAVGADLGSIAVPAAPEPPTGMETGYDFLWYADPGCTVRLFFDQTAYDAYSGVKFLYTAMPDGDLTVYGAWTPTPVQYTLTFTFPEGTPADVVMACSAGASLTAIEPPEAPEAPEGYDFFWYADPTHTARLFFDKSDYDGYSDGPKVLYTAMPDGDLTVYGGFEKQWYLIRIDPNGGEMFYEKPPIETVNPVTGETVRSYVGSKNATYFWKTYHSDYVQEYTWITRDYVASESGAYYYADHSYANRGPDRLTYYTPYISEATTLTTYKYAPGSYVSNGWYRVNEDGSETLYTFGSPIEGNLTLKLHWKLADTIFLQLNTEVTGPDGEKLTGELRSVSTAVPSEAGYADQAEIVLGCSAEAPTGWSFQGWTVRGDDSGKLYYPGDTFTLPGEYAVTVNGEKTVFLDAVYVRVKTAKIIYNANGGTVAKDANVGSPVGTGVASGKTVDTTGGTAALEAMANNIPVKLSTGEGFAHPAGGTLEGWYSLEPDGSRKLYALGSDHDANGKAYYVDVEEPTVLYALWAFTVYYDSNGGSFVAARWPDCTQIDDAADPHNGQYKQTVYVHDRVWEPGEDAVVSGTAGVIFDFWSTAPGGDRQSAYDFTAPVESDLVLYAHYVAASMVPFHAASWNGVDRDGWKRTPNLRVTETGIDLTSAEELAFYAVPDEGYEFAYVCLAPSFAAIGEHSKTAYTDYQITKIKRVGETVKVTLASDPETWVELTDGMGEIYVVYKNRFSADNRLKLSYVLEGDSCALSQVQGKSNTVNEVTYNISYNKEIFSFLNKDLLPKTVNGTPVPGVLNSNIVASGSITTDGDVEVVSGQILTLGETPLEISQASGSGIFNVPPLLDNADDLNAAVPETLTLVYDNAGIGAAAAGNISDVTGLSRRLFLRYYDGQLQWSHDGAEWNAFAEGEDTLFIVYRQRGNVLHIVSSLTVVDSGIDPDMTFEVTVTSTAITRDSYDAEGTGYSTVEATPAVGAAPGSITLSLKAGSDVSIIGLGSGAYTVTQRYNPNYTLSAKVDEVTDDSLTVNTSNPSKYSGSISFTMDQDKRVDLLTRPEYICRVVNQAVGETKTFYTLNRALDYIKTEMDGEGGIDLLRDYVVPSWDALEIPQGFIVTLSSYSPGGSQSFSLKWDEGFTGGTMLANYGELTLNKITLDGEGIPVRYPMLENNGQLTADTGATLQNALRAGSGGMVVQRTGSITVNTGSTFANNYASGSGGAIYAESGLVTVSGGTFRENRAGNGGAVYYGGSGEVTVSGGTFELNYATASGGAIYAVGGAISVTGGTFSKNGRRTVSGVPVTYETVTENGGAFYTVNADLSLAGCTVSENAAKENGGAVFAAEGKVRLIKNSSNTYSTVTGNIAGGSGGALYLGGGSMEFIAGSLTKNQAADEGGAIYLDSGILTMSGGEVGKTDTTYANRAANGAGIFIDSGSAAFTGGSVKFNIATSGGALGVGGPDVRLSFSGKTVIINNIADTGSGEHSSNVYLDQNSDDVLSFAGLDSSASIGIYVADALRSKRGIPGANFASYTSNQRITKITNDRDDPSTTEDDFEVVADASTSKLFWGKPIAVMVRYQDDPFKDSGYPPEDTDYTVMHGGTVIEKYYPIMSDDGYVALSTLAVDLYNNYSLGFSSETTAAYAGAYKNGSGSFGNYATKLTWDIDNTRWVLTGYCDDVQVPMEAADTLVVYYAEPAYIAIENNTTGTLTISGLSLNGRSVVNVLPVAPTESEDPSTGTPGYAGYGMVFAKNGAIRSALLPIQSSDLVLARNTSVTLLIPGGRNTEYTLTGRFTGYTGNSEGKVDLKTSKSDGSGLDSVALDVSTGSFTFPTGKKTLNQAGTYQIIFGAEKEICQVNGQKFSKISSAINYINNYRDSFPDSTFATGVKAATIEMLVDYLLPASDKVDIPAGLDITLTTVSGYTNPLVPNEHRATISRDSENTNAMLTVTKGINGTKKTRFIIKDLIIDGRSVRGNSDGGAISTTNCRLIVDNVEFRNIYAGNGGAIFATSDQESSVTKTHSYVEVTNCTFYKCHSTKTGSRDGGGAIHAYVDQLVLKDCYFELCEADWQAGAVFHKVEDNKVYSTAEVFDCTFTSCQSKAAGGLELGSRMNRVRGCKFLHCYATERNGGGFNVYALKSASPTDDCWTIVEDCIFDDCHVVAVKAEDGNGGGFRSTSKYTTIINTTFNNTSGKRGGAVGLSSTNASKAEIYGCTIHDGTATDTGGGIHFAGLTLKIGDCYTYTYKIGDRDVSVRVYKSGDNYYLMPESEVHPSKVTEVTEGSGTYVYTFTKTVDGVSKTVTIPVRRTGDSVSGYRYFTMGKTSVGEDGEVGYELDTSGTIEYTVEAQHSSITDCKATNRGGGVNMQKDANGTSLTVTNATISRNRSVNNNGGGIAAYRTRNITVTGSTVSGNQSKGDGGGIWVGDSGTLYLTVDGTSVTNNTSGGIGGGIYSYAHLTLRNGVKITGNQITSNPAKPYDNAAGVYIIDNRKLTVGIEESVFRTAYLKEHPTATDAQVNKAWEDWKDDTTVKNNTTSTSAPSDLRLWMNNDRVNDNAASVLVNCNLSGEIRVTNPGTTTSKFGTRVGETFSGFTEENHVFVADTGGLYGVFDRADPGNLIWRGGVVCKITDASGKLLYMDEACTDPAVFDRLDYHKNITGFPNGDGSRLSPFSYLRQPTPLLYRKGDAGPVDLTKEGICIKMLVGTFETDTYMTTKGKTAAYNINCVSITLTTASATDTDRYPYTGRAGTYAVIKRAGSFTNSMINTSVNLTLKDITLDGGSADKTNPRTATENGGLVRADTSGISISVYLMQNAILQNSRISGKNGGAVYLNNGASLYIQGGAIYNCSTTDNGGGVYKDNGAGALEFSRGNISQCTATNGGGVYFNNGSAGFIMSGGGSRITGCTATEKGGGVYLNAQKTMRMSAGFITGNRAGTDGGGVFLAYHKNTRLYLSGRVTISGNTAGEIGSEYKCNVQLGTQADNPSYNSTGTTCDWDTVITSEDSGIARNSYIGIYVPGTESPLVEVTNGSVTELKPLPVTDASATTFDRHGIESRKFGNFTDEHHTSYLYCFINDRNGLKGGMMTGDKKYIYWVKIFSLQVQNTIVSAQLSETEQNSIELQYTVTFSKTLNGSPILGFGNGLDEDYFFDIVDAEGNTTDSVHIINGTATFKLKNGWTATADGLPAEFDGGYLYYRVEQENDDRFTTTTYRSSGTGGDHCVFGTIGENLHKEDVDSKYCSNAFFDNLNAICKLTTSKNGGALLYMVDRQSGSFLPAVFSALYDAPGGTPVQDALTGAYNGAFNAVNAKVDLWYYDVFQSKYVKFNYDGDDVLSVEMLVENYRMSQQVVLNAGKKVTLTTASPTAGDGYPYVGDPKKKCTLIRKKTGDTVNMTKTLFDVWGDLTLKGITLDGRTSKLVDGSPDPVIEDYTLTGSSQKGGLVRVEDNAKLTVTTGAVLQNSKTKVGNGAAVYVGARGEATMNGGTVQNNACLDNGSNKYSGGAFYVSAWDGNGGKLTLSGSPNILNNSCESGNGAGIYLARATNTGSATGTATLYLSGSPNFGGTGVVSSGGEDTLSSTSGNFVNVSGGSNGGLEYQGGKARQDIYIAEQHADAPTSIVVNDSLTGVDGSVWVYAEAEAHYAMQKPFASMTDAVKTGVDTGKKTVSYTLFRNARPDGDTHASGTYLTGKVKTSGDPPKLEDQYIYWTGGTDVRFRKRTALYDDAAADFIGYLNGAEFTVYSDVADVAGSTVATGTSATDTDSGEEGWVVMKNLPSGVYYMKETAAPTGDSYALSGAVNTRIYILAVGTDKLNAIKTEAATFEGGVFSEIAEADVAAQTGDDGQFAIFLYDPVTGKAVPASTTGTTAYQAPDIKTCGVLNVPVASRRVILKKTDNIYDPLSGATFDILYADMTVAWKDQTSGSGGAIWIGDLPYGVYYLHETTPPTGYTKHVWYRIKVDATGVTTLSRWEADS